MKVQFYCICLVYYLFMHNYMRHKVKQSKFAVMPVYRPRYTLNITLHSIFLLTLNCHLIHAFSMLSSILDSTSKTQDLILPCQLRSTLPNLRSRSNVQFSCKCLLLLLITVFTLWLTILLICSGSNIRLFADDTSLFIIVDNPTTAALCLNSDLEKLSRWAAIWLVTFNPSKNESLLISRKINKPIHPPLYMQNVQIQEVSSHKHLGLYFSNDCSWFRIHIMRKLKFKLDCKSLETIYLTFVRPLLEYG